MTWISNCDSIFWWHVVSHRCPRLPLFWFDDSGLRLIGTSASASVWWSLTARSMGPTWGPPGADRAQVGPMLAPWTLLSGLLLESGGSVFKLHSSKQSDTDTWESRWCTNARGVFAMATAQSTMFANDKVRYGPKVVCSCLHIIMTII